MELLLLAPGYLLGFFFFFLWLRERRLRELTEDWAQRAESSADGWRALFQRHFASAEPKAH